MEFHSLHSLMMMISSSIIHILSWQTEKKVLARAARFCLPPKEVDVYDVKCSFELLFRDLNRNGPFFSTEDQDSLKSRHKNISYNYIYSYDFSTKKHTLNMKSR